MISSTDGDGARLALGLKISENWPENAILNSVDKRCGLWDYLGMETKKATTEALEAAYYGALDNELAEGHDGQEARVLVLRRYQSYADNYEIRADEFLAFIRDLQGAH